MKKILSILALLFLIVVIGFLIHSYKNLNIISSYSAKSVCSCVYTAGRPFETAMSDLDFFPASLGKSTINKAEKSITSSVFGLKKKTATYTKGLGCSLEHDGKANQLNFNPPSPPVLSTSLNWPFGTSENWDNVVVNQPEKLEDAFNYAFQPEHKTRALLVVKDNVIVKEKYADGFDKNTPQTGWSMTKSMAASLVGILSKQGKIDIDQPLDIEAWKKDERKKITMRHLLAMGSGLEWEEDYFSNSDVNKMLWNSSNTYEVSVDQPLEFEPGTVREYSSGTTNLISGYLRKLLGNDQQYWELPYKELLYKIGMNSAEMETDEAGNYVMSSHCYATARDWAKYGLLYLYDGMWNGEEILPRGWVKSTVTPDPNDINYGWLLLLNTEQQNFIDAPKDLAMAGGFNGQKVFIIPSENMVIVRLGVSDDFDANKVVGDIVAAFKTQATPSF